MKKEKGFTLIELLVVIAIIGILASVVLASLNSARAKGADAAVKSSLNNMRAQAELYYDNNSSSYLNLCSDPTVVNALNAAKNAAGVATLTTATGTASTLTSVTCHASSTAWAIEGPLKSTTGTYCVNSAGLSTTTSGVTLGVNEVDCN